VQPGQRAFVRLVILCLPLLFQACAGTTDKISLSDLDSDEGYIVFRFYSSRMANDPSANWGKDVRLQYRPISAGPIDAWTSSMKLRGRYVKAVAGNGPSVQVMKLSGGEYVFYSVITSLQEKAVSLRFDVRNGAITYIGDVVLDVDVAPGALGATQINSAHASIRWAPERIQADLLAQYPKGVPTVQLGSPR